MSPLRLRWALLLWVLLGGVAGAGDHIRVVLDTSVSMNTNDGSHFAALSTLLLFDLSRINPPNDGSFEVLHFNRAADWQDPSRPPPTATEPPISANGGRQKLSNDLRNLMYEARATYFFPGLNAAINDLESRSVGLHDVRIVVLITDGLPTHKDREASLFSEQLESRIKGGIRLYVVAFGPKAAQSGEFFRSLLKDGGDLGDVFVDQDGSQLLDTMIAIFSRSFGYQAEATVTLPVSSVDLAGGGTPEEVALVVFHEQVVPPQVSLSAPANSTVNAPEPPLAGREAGASYTLQWVLRPDDGEFGLNTLSGHLAVLRPSELNLKVVPLNDPVHLALANRVHQLGVLVRPPTGDGDPGMVDLTFTLYRGRDALGGSKAATEIRLDHKGRLYGIEVQFPHDDKSEADFYEGSVEIRANRRERVVAALAGPTAHAMTIYSELAMQSSPNVADAQLAPEEGGGRFVKSGQIACAPFSLQLKAGDLPHPQKPTYSLRVRLAKTVYLRDALNRAHFSFDDLPLEPDGRPMIEPGGGDWYLGRQLSASELFAQHEVCVRVGRPQSGDATNPMEVPIAMVLAETPYDKLDVVESFTLNVFIPPPSFFARYRSLLLIGGLLIALCALVWYLRDQPTLPGDLCVAIAHQGASVGLVSVPLEPASLLSSWFGWVGERPLRAPGESQTLGWVRPVDGELFQFRPGKNVNLSSEPPGKENPGNKRRISLSARRIYRLECEDIVYLFRMEYQ